MKQQLTGTTRTARTVQRGRGGASRRAGVALTALLVLGAGLMSPSAATAAPGDPVDIPDSNLRAAINDALGQAPTATITEGDAATVSHLEADDAGITDLTGIEALTNANRLDLKGNDIADLSPLSTLTNLRQVYLVGNDVADVSPLAGLTNLTMLYLNGNNITDVSPLSGLSSLSWLVLSNNAISDLSPLAGLTGLTHLYVDHNDVSDVAPLAGLTDLTFLRADDNSIADVSALSTLTDLTVLTLHGQSLRVPPAVTGAATPNPVTNIVGDPVPVTSSSPGFAYAPPPANAWTFATAGPQQIEWSEPVAFGDVTDSTFSGTISQDITAAPPVPVTPELPEVVEATCQDGEAVGPQITLPVTDGVTYSVDGTVAPGATVTVTATMDAGHVIGDVGPGWTVVGDGLLARLVLTLDTVDCSGTSVPGGADDGPAGPTTPGDRAQLPDTGTGQSRTAIALGALLTLAGVVTVVVGRRRTAIR